MKVKRLRLYKVPCSSEAFVHCCNHTDVYVRVPPIDFNRHSILNMVLEMALQC